jgi:hypothetical protein
MYPHFEILLEWKVFIVSVCMKILRLVNQSFIAWERFVGRINVRQEWRRGV